METALSLAEVSDDALIHRLGELVSSSRRVEADLIAHVGEVEARRLYARDASPSMFAYCTETLHLSEAEAYARITVARAARRHPALLAMLRDGRLHLSGLVRLVPHLTAENRERLLERATYKSKRQIEELVAELFPRPDVPTVVRKLPVQRAQPESSLFHANPGQSDAAALELCPGRVASAPPIGRRYRRRVARCRSLQRPAHLRVDRARWWLWRHRGPPSSSRCPRHATRCSSPRAPRSGTSSSASRR